MLGGLQNRGNTVSYDLSPEERSLRQRPYASVEHGPQIPNAQLRIQASSTHLPAASGTGTVRRAHRFGGILSIQSRDQVLGDLIFVGHVVRLPQGEAAIKSIPWLVLEPH